MGMKLGGGGGGLILRLGLNLQLQKLQKDWVRPPKTIPSSTILRTLVLHNTLLLIPIQKTMQLGNPLSASHHSLHTITTVQNCFLGLFGWMIQVLISSLSGEKGKRGRKFYSIGQQNYLTNSVLAIPFTSRWKVSSRLSRPVGLNRKFCFRNSFGA